MKFSVGAGNAGSNPDYQSGSHDVGAGWSDTGAGSAFG
jgi:hypothetical protein